MWDTSLQFKGFFLKKSYDDFTIFAMETIFSVARKLVKD
jgi:hypothetical protein